MAPGWHLAYTWMANNEIHLAAGTKLVPGLHLVRSYPVPSGTWMADIQCQLVPGTLLAPRVDGKYRVAPGTWLLPGK